MRLPSFRKVALTIPLVDACGLSREVGKVKRELRKLYVALGGDRTARCYVQGDMAGLKEKIKETMAGHIEQVYPELSEANPFLKKYFEPEGFRLDYGVCYRFFSSEVEKPQAVVTIEIGMIFLLHASFLKMLKEERPRVYPLMRMIVNLLHHSLPVRRLTEVYEMVSEMWEMDRIEAQTGGEEMDEGYAEAAAEEAEEYERHVLKVKGSYEGILKRIKRLHKKVSWELSEDENWFVVTATELFESWRAWNGKDLRVLEDEYDGDRNELDSFFNLLWDPSGPITEFQTNSFQEYGNSMAPQMFLGAKDRKSLEKIKEVAKSFILLECLMAGGERIWT